MNNPIMAGIRTACAAYRENRRKSAETARKRFENARKLKTHQRNVTRQIARAVCAFKTEIDLTEVFLGTKNDAEITISSYSRIGRHINGTPILRISVPYERHAVIELQALDGLQPVSYTRTFVSSEKAINDLIALVKDHLRANYKEKVTL